MLSATRVNVYEASKAQAELDAHAARAATRLLGAAPSTRLQDYRLLLTGLGTALAALAQFYPPGKYPANFWGLAFACPAYVLVNALVTFWLPAQEQDIACQIGDVTLRSNFDQMQHTYALRTSKDGPAVSRKLGELFNEDGFIRLKVLDALVQEALKKK